MQANPSITIAFDYESYRDGAKKSSIYFTGLTYKISEKIRVSPQKLYENCQDVGAE